MAKTAVPALAVRGLTKSYGAVRAVDGVEFTVERGEAIAVLGPNGAGKSTTINMILGLLTPDEGTVTVLGRTPEQAVRAGLLGAMPQEGDLVSRVSVRELIAFVRRTYPAPMPLDDVLQIAGLTGIAGRRASKLSGGQTQRVRFALALVGDPDLVVLDEPTAALDVESRHELWTAIRAYTGRGKSVVFSTHYLQEADENADRVIVIAGGRDPMFPPDRVLPRARAVFADRVMTATLADAGHILDAPAIGELAGALAAFLLPRRDSDG